MSAEALRRAAALMRERAEAATGATYHWKRGLAGTKPSPVVLCGQVRIAQTDETLTGGPSNAEHIASWHPAVALAVADWLDEAADEFDEHVGSIWIACALTVANAYLGEQP